VDGLWKTRGLAFVEMPNEHSQMEKHFVYLIACRSETTLYVKIGLTSSIQRRLSNVQTGCPHPITSAFVILSEHREEVEGLEKLLHLLLAPERLRGEWYEGTHAFFSSLQSVLTRINVGGFTYEELLDLPDNVGPELEIMMHRHDFRFRRYALPIRRGIKLESCTEPIIPEQIAAELRDNASVAG
jgi:hypothetical protein